jgi:hypothetical protein
VLNLTVNYCGTDTKYDSNANRYMVIMQKNECKMQN